MMRHYVWAVSFLTILPVAGCNELEQMKRACSWFPVVGASLGLILAACSFVLSAIMPMQVTLVLILAVNFMLTRGLHVDGLADTADGLIGTYERSRAIKAMKDSSTGVMGATALILCSLLKLSALLALTEFLLYALILAPAWGRWAIVVTAGSFKPALSTGLGARFMNIVATKQIIKATVAVICVTAVIVVIKPGLFASLLISLPLVVAATFAVAGYANARLGGLTGDVLGAVNETAEVLLLIGIVIGQAGKGVVW